VAAIRRGDSNSTWVRASAASSSNLRARSPPFLGGKPSNEKRSEGNPETASAVVTADGPGSEVTLMPAAAAAATRR